MSEQPEPTPQEDDARLELPNGEFAWGPGILLPVEDEFLYPERRMPDPGPVRPGEEPTT
jgi:hypothetical protein